MNEAESMSITPPLSPEEFFLEEPEPSPPPVLPTKEEDNLLCFCCLGDSSTKGDSFHADGFWRNKFLSRVCEEKGSNSIETDNSVSLFMFNWSNNTIMSQDLTRLFLILRQTINEVQMEASKTAMSFSLDSSTGVFEKRKQINEFLQYLQDYCQHTDVLSVEDAELLAEQLHTVVLDMGRFGDLPPHVLQSGQGGSEAKVVSIYGPVHVASADLNPETESALTTYCGREFHTKTVRGKKENLYMSLANAAHQCFHLHLDVYWRLLVMFHILHDKQPGLYYRHRLCTTADMDVENCLYDQLLHLILWDLVSLAQVRYINKVSSGDYLKTFLYSCTCVRELWLLVLKLSQWRATHKTGESFWISLHHVLKSVMDMENGSVTDTEQAMELDDCRTIMNPPEGFTVSDPTSLCLWIMYSVARLYGITDTQTQQTERSIYVNNYHDLEYLVKNHLASKTLSETSLRRHLRTCLYLSRLWEPNTNLLVILWNYFYKGLNRSDMFQVSTSTLDGLAAVDQSVVSLYDRCKVWTSSTDDQLEKDRSYQLFLRILSQHLSKFYSTGQTQEWKQMKGRIYSKFHAARIKDLTDGGLYNLTCLFITLAITADLEDVASKLCDFYDMLDMQQCTFAKRSVVWRGAFAMMLVYEEREMDISFLTDRMVAAFEGAVSDFSVAGLDTRHPLWKLLLIYLEGTQEIMDASKHLCTSEYKLICPAFKSLLSACSAMEMRTVLSALQSVITKFRQTASSKKNAAATFITYKPPLQHLDFSSHLWRSVYPFIVDHSQTLTPPEQIADLAAGFCLMALNFPPSETLGSKETFVNVFQTFACSDKTNVSISSRFLSHTLTNEEVMNRLSLDLKDCDKVILSTWFRCCLHLPGSSHTLAEVTRPVLQLPEVQTIFQSAEMNIPDTDLAPVMFLKAIEKAHRRFQSWQDKMQFQKQISEYFVDVVKHVSGVVRAMSPTESVLNVYRMTGYLVKHCAKLIYVRQDAVVPSLINTLVVPHHVMTQDKPLHPVLMSAVKETLHLFILGLSKLSFDRDPFLQRRMKDIITVYLPKFSLNTSSVSMTTMVHPIVASLAGSFIQQPLPEAIKFRHYVIGLVVNSFIYVKNFSIHPNHIVGWSFVNDVMKRTASSQMKARDLPVLLPHCLEYLLLLPDNSSALYVSVVHMLQQMAEAYTHNTDLVKREELCTLCERYITTYFKFSSNGVLKVLEKLAILQSDIVGSVIPKLTENVRELEKKRGVGVDQSLRHRYYQVLQQLGERGREEINRLKTDKS